MVIKNELTHEKNEIEQMLDCAVLIERLKRLRAMNRKPDRIGLTQYTWHSFSIDKARSR